MEKCPACGFENEEGINECLECGLVFLIYDDESGIVRESKSKRPLDPVISDHLEIPSSKFHYVIVLAIAFCSYMMWNNGLTTADYGALGGFYVMSLSLLLLFACTPSISYIKKRFRKRIQFDKFKNHSDTTKPSVLKTLAIKLFVVFFGTWFSVFAIVLSMHIFGHFAFFACAAIMLFLCWLLA